MVDERGESRGVARRTFLATAGAGLALGTGTGSARTDGRADAPLVFEVDADARRLAAAIASDLEIEDGAVETVVRRAGTERWADGSPAHEPDIRIATDEEPSGSDLPPNDSRTRFVVPLDAARFVPATERWYYSRASLDRESRTRSGGVERWVEYDVVRPDDASDRASGRLAAGLRRVRPRRPPGSAATVLVYGTRAFQYSSGFGGHGQYEVDGDRLRSLRPGAAGSLEKGMAVIRTARVAVEPDSENARDIDLERAVARYATGSAVEP